MRLYVARQNHRRPNRQTTPGHHHSLPLLCEVGCSVLAGRGCCLAGTSERGLANCSFFHAQTQTEPRWERVNIISLCGGAQDLRTTAAAMIRSSLARWFCRTSYILYTTYAYEYATRRNLKFAGSSVQGMDYRLIYIYVYILRIIYTW